MPEKIVSVQLTVEEVDLLVALLEDFYDGADEADPFVVISRGIEAKLLREWEGFDADASTDA